MTAYNLHTQTHTHTHTYIYMLNDAYLTAMQLAQTRWTINRTLQTDRHLCHTTEHTQHTHNITVCIVLSFTVSLFHCMQFHSISLWDISICHKQIFCRSAGYCVLWRCSPHVDKLDVTHIDPTTVNTIKPQCLEVGRP